MLLCYTTHRQLRVSYTGIMGPCQGPERGSTPLTRSGKPEPPFLEGFWFACQGEQGVERVAANELEFYGILTFSPHFMPLLAPF